MSPNAAAAANPAAHTVINLCTSLLTNLSCATQNVNSLNISTNCPKQLKKINAIASLNSDIIFLSDTRLNTNTHGPCADLENIFLYTKGKQYNFHYNSKGSSRGVGILISTKVNINVIDMYRDDDDNILGVLCESEGAHLLLISVYGHNTNTNSHIFLITLTNVSRALKMQDVSLVVTGI